MKKIQALPQRAAVNVINYVTQAQPGCSLAEAEYTHVLREGFLGEEAGLRRTWGPHALGQG